MLYRLLILLFISTGLFAQSAGESGISFLKIGFGARNIALGDVGVVSADDVTALNYNPALLSKFNSSQLMLTHTEWIKDVRSELLGASFSLFGLPFALGLNTTSISGIEVRTKPGEASSTFSAHYFYGSLSTGFSIYENLSFGTTLKIITESLYTDESNGYAFDFGLHYSNLIEGLNLGASIRNIGSMNNLRSEESKLPVDMRFGAGYNYSLQSIESDLYFAAGYQKYTTSDKSHFNLGAEFFYNKLIAIRAGYMTGYESRGLTAGLGLTWNQLNFDYAFTPWDFELGNSHIISVRFTF